MKYSRLIAIAACRAVVAQTRTMDTEAAMKVVSKYAVVLNAVYRRYRPVFEEEFNAAIEEGLLCDRIDEIIRRIR